MVRVLPVVRGRRARSGADGREGIGGLRRQRSAVIRLTATVVVVLAAAVFLLGVRPLYDMIRKGLDLQGGIQIVYQAESAPGQPLTASALQRTVQVISYRVNRLGVSEPIVQSEPKVDRILIELAGVKDPNQAQKIIGTPAVLQFKSDKGKVVVTGADLQKASAQIVNGQNQVLLQFDPAGAKAFAAFTKANQLKHMGIYLDSKQIQNPVIDHGCCTNGQAVISGAFPKFADAQNLAIQLDSGALPLKLHVLSKTAVSPTLGAQSVRASKVAALVALILVAAFMFLVYRIPGFWADLALLVYAILLMAALVGVHATLTLPGITGMILSIGIAVDSNVIIFERIREELRHGRTLRRAVDEGFHHGLRAILDSNATTIIATVVLYELGQGLIRGFAVTLGIGVVISLLTAVVFTRYLLHWLVDAGVVPSWWFFAARGTPQPAPAAAGAAVASAVRAPSRPSGAAGRRGGGLFDMRREWTPDIPVHPPSPPPPDGAQAPAAPDAPALEEAGAGSPVEDGPVGERTEPRRPRGPKPGQRPRGRRPRKGGR